MSFTVDFKTSAISNYRDPRSRVQIQWNSSTTSETLVATTNDENRAALMTQVTNGTTETNRKWAYCSTGLGTNELIADGSFYPMPDNLVSALFSGDEVGWYGTTASDSNGEWLTYPILTLEYSQSSLTGATMTIQCDDVYNEYPVDYTVNIYDGITLLFSDAVTGNTSTTIDVDLTGQTLNVTDKVELVIEKWSTPYGIVKINEFNFDTTVTYYGSDVVSLDFLEEMEYDSGTIPIGNISCNQVNLKLLNTNDRFTYGNTNSPFNNLLLKDRQIKAWLGFVLPSGTSDTSTGTYIVETINGEKVGFVPMGTFYSDDWITNRRGLDVKTFGRDIFEKLRDLEFNESELYENYSLFGLTNAVLTSANSKLIAENEISIEWEIESFLTQIVIPYAYFPRTTYFEALKQIVEIGQTTAFVNRDGKIIVGAVLD